MKEVIIVIEPFLGLLPNTLWLYLIGIGVIIFGSFVRETWYRTRRQIENYLVTLLFVWLGLTFIGFVSCIYTGCSASESLKIGFKFSILWLALIDFGLDKLSKKI